MKRMAIILSIMFLVLIAGSFVLAVDTGNNTAGCKTLYWIDNDNKECGQKEFCGAYMYLGLRTFENPAQCELAVSETGANIERPKNITFIPWQKRDGSECPQGCSCQGAVVSCRTADGKTMTIEAGRSGNIITVTVDGKEADTNLTLETEVDEDNSTKINADLSTGKKDEIKIMPNTASEKAIAKLGDIGFTIELKEVGKGTNAKAVYELTGNKQGKFLGIFKIMARVQAQVDAGTGDTKVIKPWWSFLASGV